MELEDLLCDGLLEWLWDDEPGFSGDIDLEQLLAAASDVYEQSTDPNLVPRPPPRLYLAADFFSTAAR